MLSNVLLRLIDHFLLYYIVRQSVHLKLRDKRKHL